MSITRPLSRIRSTTSARPVGCGARCTPPPTPLLVMAVVAIVLLPQLERPRPDDDLLRDEPLFDERPPPFELDDERRLLCDEELPLFFDEPRLRLREDELLLLLLLRLPLLDERFGSPPLELPRLRLDERL